MNKNNVLDLEFKSRDLCRTITIRQFFFELTAKLWVHQEDFSSKRPFGNSSWNYDLISCLIKNKLVKGGFDEDGYLIDYDNEEIDKFVINQILKPLFSVN